MLRTFERTYLRTFFECIPWAIFTTLIFFVNFHILSSIMCTFYIENDAEIFPAHYTWKVTEKGFKMAFIMNKLAMINSCEIILEK